MKKQKMMTTGFLTAALMLSFAGTCFADTAPAAETQAAGQEEAGAQAVTERKTLPASFGMPYSFPTKGQHPRVMFTEKDIPAIRANMANEEGAYAMEELKKLLAQDVDGMLPDDYVYSGKSNFDYNTFAVIQAYAFDYVINGNVENGKRAIEATRNVVTRFKYKPKASDIVREKGATIYLSAMVYDWCYPLMSQEDKSLFVAKAEELAATITGMGGWPITEVYSVNGHNEETHIKRDLLALSIACYDEYPDIYNHVGGYVMNGLAPTKNWWYRSGTYHQGLGYNPLRFDCDLSSYFLFYRMNGTKIFSDDMAKVPYMEVYNQRPDGRSFPEGDTNGDSLVDKIPTWTRGDMPHLLYVSSLWDDGYLKGEFQRCSKNFKWLSYKSFHPLITPVHFLIVNDPYVEPKSRTELPLTRLYGSPVGMMLARTGFNEGVEQPDMLVWAKIGETYAGNHAHLDSGSFQIYYKGQLAWDNGRYDAFGSQHDANYAKETIAHNSLLIYDPNEEMISETTIPEPKNSGGQRRPGKAALSLEDLSGEDNHKADLLAMEYGEDPMKPEYSYISGDLAPGYSDKVSEVRRSMLFMPTGIENKPGIFVVMDKVTAKDPAFKKSFLLHSLQAPEVKDNVTVIKRDQIGYNGKLINQTLYPKNPEITTIGGPERQNWVVDRNYAPQGGKYYTGYDPAKSSEHGWGRVEISPSTPAKTDYFLNVMYATDADNLEPVDEAELIETDVLLGARILDKATLFVKDKERYSGEMTVTIPGEGQIAATLAGITAGEWTITDDNGNVQTKTAKEEGGIIYFTGQAGTYHIQMKK
ncbi:heparinase II/III domain-containing protein [Enterocloster alcoholdehydrogenati]|uniref:heparinase II/III domain-containing protein n=1 Tax=Enterocloster alcoholdehydrogenati TaxID=2547410 RepID=UPI0015945BA1|nr:heparinase II/III family protein [Enterocloster alcoholdehydrogenati]